MSRILVVEDQAVLRERLPAYVIVKPHERRRLLKLGKRVEPAIKQLISTIRYRTCQRWVAEANQPENQRKKSASPAVCANRK